MNLHAYHDHRLAAERGMGGRMKRGIVLAWGVGIWACGSSGGGGEALPGADAGADATVITGTPSVRLSILAPTERVSLVRGESVTVSLKIARDSVGEAIKVVATGLPNGVTAAELVFPPAETTGSLVLTAAADLPAGSAKVTLQGTAEDAAKSTGSGSFDLLVRGKPGEIDTTFGTQGQTTRTFNAPDSLIPMALGVDASDRLCMVALCVRQGNVSLCAGRLGADGAIDASFGSAGVYEKADFGVFGGYVYPDGRIVAAGYDSGAGALFTRLDAQGAPDATFGSGSDGVGMKRITHPEGTTQQGYFVAPRPAGGVLVGYQIDRQGLKLGLAALKEDGSVDTSVFGDGYAWGEGSYASNDFFASGVVVRANGHVVAAGVQAGFNPALWGAFQLTTAGDYDTQFKTTGMVSAPFTGGDSFVGYGTVLLSDGSLVFAVSKNSNAAGALVKLQPDGTPDSAFASGGALDLPEAPLAVARQVDDKLVVALGTKKVGRFASGQADSTFGTAGITTVVPSATGGRARVALQKDGRILHMVATPTGMVVTRLWH
jgi:uncharacterized delta-60 repeat protein